MRKSDLNLIDSDQEMTAEDHRKNSNSDILTYMKLNSNLQFCHEGSKTLRADFYFNLGALVSWWQKRITSKFLYLIRRAVLSPEAAALVKLHRRALLITQKIPSLSCRT
jgi:hypothetical protein